MTWSPDIPKPEKRLNRKEKKQQTRRSLIGAAYSLFAAKGMEATTIDEIAATAGYTRGAFYAHFPHKEAIMEELIAHGFESDTEAVNSFDENLTVDEMAEHYQEYSRRFTEQPTSLLWALEFQLSALRHPELRDEYNRQFRRLRSRIGALVTGHLSDNTSLTEYEIAETEQAAEALVALQTGLAVQRLLDPDRVQETIFARTFRTIMRDLVPPDSIS